MYIIGDFIFMFRLTFEYTFIYVTSFNCRPNFIKHKLS